MKAKWNRESKAKAMTEYEVTEMAMRIQQKYQDEGYRQTLLRNGIDIDIIEQELDAYAKKKGINI